MPDLVVMAGPNRAGNTTIAGVVLKEWRVAEFLDADAIAADGG
jgi:predicted ABC-type ATPase